MINEVTISGRVKMITKSHKMYDEQFYLMIIESERMSGAKDEIPVIVSEKYCAADMIRTNVLVIGQFRSYNEGTKLKLFVFALDVFRDEGGSDMNDVDIEGYICKNPTFRTTPQGREITDLTIANNRQYGKSDYIPCIAWGRDAKYCSGLMVGELVHIHGRIQSRLYQKNGINKMAYELSIRNIC